MMYSEPTDLKDQNSKLELMESELAYAYGLQDYQHLCRVGNIVNVFTYGTATQPLQTR